jgi:hypothetical protein
MKDDCLPTSETPSRRAPWNKGKLIGTKPPLRPSVVDQNQTADGGD